MKSPKSNINFDFIEFEISEKDLENFKKSIAQGCIRRVDQVNAHKWHYIIKADDKLLEIEVSYNKNNLKQFSCACGAHSPGKICKHVQLASYWHVSALRSKNESSFSSFNTAYHELNNSNEEDLRYYINFLSRQSKINKEWLYFFDNARAVSDDPYRKYILLTEHFFRFIEVQTRNSVSKIKFQLQFFEELYFISFYHYKLSNIEDSIQAILAGIIKLQEWHYKIDWKNQPRLVSINEKMHLALEQFLTAIIAPRALNKLFKMISELVIRPEYLILNEKSNLFIILKTHFKKESQSKIFFNSLIDKLNLNIREEYKFYILDYLYIQFPLPLKEYLIKVEINVSVYWVLSWLESRKSKIPSDYLLELFSNIYEVSTKEMKSLVALKIAELYTHNHDVINRHLLIRYYLETGQINLLEVYFKDQEFTDERFNFFLNDLEENLLNIKLTLVQKIDLAYYSKQWQLLINLFQQSDDMDYILKVDSKFPEEFHSQLLDVYVKLSKKYLDSHVGQKSHLRIDLIAKHLKSVFRAKYFSMYVNELKHLYPNRMLISQNY